MEEKFNQLASTVLNSPIELYVGTDRNSKISAKPGIESQQMFLHKRIRWRIKFFCGAVKQVFTIAFLNMFQRARNDIERLRYYHFTHNRSIEDVMKLERMLDFQVVFKPSASNMEMSQIIEFYRHGIIDEDAAFNMFFQKIGFTDPPVKAPVEFKERMQDLYRKTREEEANLQTNAKTKKREREELVRQPKAKKSKKDETDSPSKKKKD